MGKLSPYLVIGVVQTMMLLAIIHLLFNVPLPPATLALVAVTPIFVGAYLILGLPLRSRPWLHTQIQAVQAAVFCYPPS